MEAFEGDSKEATRLCNIDDASLRLGGELEHRTKTPTRSRPLDVSGDLWLQRFSRSEIRYKPSGPRMPSSRQRPPPATRPAHNCCL